MWRKLNKEEEEKLPRGLLLSCCLLFCFFAGSISVAAEEFHLSVLATGNTLAQVLPVDDLGTACPPSRTEACIGGVARRATTIEQVRAEEEHTLLLEAGSLFQGSLYYFLFEGEELAFYYRRLGYDAICLSLREFFSGIDILSRFIDESGVVVVSANLDVSREGRLIGKVKPYHIFPVGSYRVGFTGEIDPLVTRGGVSEAGNVTTISSVEGIRLAVAAMLDKGVDIIIVAVTTRDKTLVSTIQNQIYGIDLIIASNVDVVNEEELIPSRSRTPWKSPIGFMETGTFGRALARVDLDFNNKGLITSLSGGPILLDSSIPENATIQADVEERYELIEDAFGVTLGFATAEFPWVRDDYCYFQECELGNFVTDAILAYTKTGSFSIPAQIAVDNAGAAGAAIPAGNITLGTIVSAFPFHVTDTLSVVSLRGATLWKAMENSVAEATNREVPSGRFLQVSGLHVAWNPDQPVGQRIIRLELQREDGTRTPIQNEGTYIVAMQSYLREGGDNFTMFREDVLSAADQGPTLILPITEALEVQKRITPSIQGRIVTTSEIRTNSEDKSDEDLSDENIALIAALVPTAFICLLLLGFGVIGLWARNRYNSNRHRIQLKQPNFKEITFADSSAIDKVKAPGIGSPARLDVFEKVIVDPCLIQALYESAPDREHWPMLSNALVCVHATAVHSPAHFVLQLLLLDLDASTNQETLLREDTLATFCFQNFARTVSLPFLWSTFAYTFAELYRNSIESTKRRISEETGEETPGYNMSLLSLDTSMMEINDEKMEEGGDEDINKLQLHLLVHKLFLLIIRSVDRFPKQLRWICKELQQRNPDAKENSVTLANLIFLRFICPAFVLPHHYGLLDAPPPTNMQRLLILISKVLQNLANGVQFGEKESFMTKMNEFIKTNESKMESFLQHLAEFDAEEPACGDPPSSIPPKALRKAALSALDWYVVDEKGEEILDSLSDMESNEAQETYSRVHFLRSGSALLRSSDVVSLGFAADSPHKSKAESSKEEQKKNKDRTTRNGKRRKSAKHTKVNH
ncbi:GTPaseactivator protein for Ras-like GTPase [Balamuthia mandrillaris]